MFVRKVSKRLPKLDAALAEAVIAILATAAAPAAIHGFAKTITKGCIPVGSIKFPGAFPCAAEALLNDLDRVQSECDRRTNHGVSQGVRFH